MVRKITDIIRMRQLIYINSTNLDTIQIHTKVGIHRNKKQTQNKQTKNK